MFTILGRELKQFFFQNPDVMIEGAYVDDEVFHIDGVCSVDVDIEAIGDSAVVEIETGYLMEQPETVPSDLVEAIVWWRKQHGVASNTDPKFIVQYRMTHSGDLQTLDTFSAADGDTTELSIMTQAIGRLSQEGVSPVELIVTKQ